MGNFKGWAATVFVSLQRHTIAKMELLWLDIV